MITIESTEKEIRVSSPRDEVDPVRLDRLLRPLRLDAALSGAGMADEDADRMAKEMKATWREENRHRFQPGGHPESDSCASRRMWTRDAELKQGLRAKGCEECWEP